ncbi:hypothetical protein JCM11491_000650 [Sporobolomyces phaffii]
MTASSPPSSASPVDLLILGAGWTSTFLVPHLGAAHPSVSFASTTRDGRDGSIRWEFDPRAPPSDYDALPTAKTVLVTFPIKGAGGIRALVEGYESAKGQRARWIQLGSTGIWDGGPTLIGSKLANSDPTTEKDAPLPPAYSSQSDSPSFTWTDRHSAYDKTNPRAIAEDELLGMHSDTFVLNLSGLWGGERDPSNWIPRIASSKQALEVKGSLHLIHGLDVARAIVSVHLSSSPSSEKARAGGGTGRRYLLTDLRVIDWWDLASRYPRRLASSGEGEETPEAFTWVQELMREHGVRALPRSPHELGRALDSTEFWHDFGLMPIKGSYEKGRL